MREMPDIIGTFNERVRRHVGDALSQYRDELRAVSHEMAARGLVNSGPHLKRRVEVLRKWTTELTDQCFEDVTRLPGNQDMHRFVHAEFLSQQLHDFFQQAERDVLVRSFGDAADSEVKRQIALARDGLNHDLKDFQAGLWSPRAPTKGSSVTNNTVNIHALSVGSIQQGGDGATLIATGEFSAGAVAIALDEFARTVENAQVSDEVRRDIKLELETIRPQLSKAAPSTSIIRESVKSLRTIVEGTASTLLAAAFVALWKASGN